MSNQEREESGIESNVEDQELSQEFKSSRKRKAYSIEKKLEAVDYANNYSKLSAARRFTVSRCMVQQWVKNADELRQQQ